MNSTKEAFETFLSFILRTRFCDILSISENAAEEDLRTFALIVSAHPTAHANSHATSCMSARTK